MSTGKTKSKKNRQTSIGEAFGRNKAGPADDELAGARVDDADKRIGADVVQRGDLLRVGAAARRLPEQTGRLDEAPHSGVLPRVAIQLIRGKLVGVLQIHDEPTRAPTRLARRLRKTSSQPSLEKIDPVSSAKT